MRRICERVIDSVLKPAKTIERIERKREREIAKSKK